METRARIQIDREEIARFCERNGIRKLSLFGSVLRDDFDLESDVDVLVEFEPGGTPNLMDMVGLEIELGEILGRNVDLRTPAGLSQYIRPRVLSDAETLYVHRR